MAFNNSSKFFRRQTDIRADRNILRIVGKVFYKALSMFKYRKLYANTCNDRTVPFWTAAIVDVNPFDNMGKLNM